MLIVHHKYSINQGYKFIFEEYFNKHYTALVTYYTLLMPINTLLKTGKLYYL